VYALERQTPGFLRALRVAVVGGGPAGLFCAALLRQSGGRHQVTVYERNPALETYGWGLVLSESALEAVRAADPPTHARLVEARVTFDAIEVRVGPEAMRAGGHPYSALSRHRLLAILQHRCAELGVDCRYGTRVDDLADLAGADVVVGADGINSRVRGRIPAFRPHLEGDELRYVWLAAERRFEAMSIIARQSGEDWFQAHVYPFDQGLSTFVVFCREEAWRRAGLDGAGEAGSIDFCQRLFAADLEGARLLANGSRWRVFRTVRCASWHHGNTVLVGDAAHTLHPTIGSGTKLALEDAAALVQALDDSPGPEAAFARYEVGRKRAADSYQAAAAASREFCAHLGSYVGAGTAQFALQLLTRSQRLDYDDLRRRDPDFIRAVERRLAKDVARSVPGLDLSVERTPVRLPLRLGRHTLANRLVLTPPGTWARAAFGTAAPARDELRRAAGGCPGAVLVDAATLPPAHAAGRPWREAVERLRRRTGAALILRIRPDRWPAGELAHAARLAAAAGFEVVEVDLSPQLADARPDGVRGQELEERWERAEAVIRTLLAAAPDSLAVSAAVPCPGRSPDDDAVKAVTRFASMLRAGGGDLLHLLPGPGPDRPASALDHLALTRCAAHVRNQGRLPTMLGLDRQTPGVLNAIIASGQADLCAVTSCEPAFWTEGADYTVSDRRP
jgi:anthraniloyl-CoA monooxygenase